jgi:hypothetical protein
MFGQPFHKKGIPLPAVQKPKLRIGQGAVNPQRRLPGKGDFGIPLEFFRHRNRFIFPGSNNSEGTDPFGIFPDDPVPSPFGTDSPHMLFQGGTGGGIFNKAYHGKNIVKTEKIQPVVGTGTLKEDGAFGQFPYTRFRQTAADYLFHHPLHSRRKGCVIEKF